MHAGQVRLLLQISLLSASSIPASFLLFAGPLYLIYRPLATSRVFMLVVHHTKFSVCLLSKQWHLSLDVACSQLDSARFWVQVLATALRRLPGPLPSPMGYIQFTFNAYVVVLELTNFLLIAPGTLASPKLGFWLMYPIHSIVILGFIQCLWFLSYLPIWLLQLWLTARVWCRSHCRWLLVIPHLSPVTLHPWQVTCMQVQVETAVSMYHSYLPWFTV